MRKKWMAMAAAAVLISGCASAEPANTNEQRNEINPLTGVESSDTARRTMAVVVSNHPSARPQTALDEADMVYEILTEGGITRFLALYQSEYPDKIGPVRSARDYFIELAEGYNALFLAHGYSPEAQGILLSGDIDQLNGIQYDGGVFKRDGSQKEPHNSYVDVEQALDVAEQKGYSLDAAPSRLSFLTEKEERSLTGEPAETLSIRPSSNDLFESVYEFDGDSYHRSIGGAEVRTDNIFVIEADHRVIDAKGRLDIDLKSGGDAFLIQDGLLNLVKWRNQNGRIVPYTENGAAFVTGKTWIHIVPASRGLNKAVNVEIDGEGNGS
ncbi:DUF3048 domain-containing protein [Domibacillus iocasae]|uniref:Lipoprotein YerB n=1 Tax=Domibacillus iocasae TaxID=1714016 RepID=A0A1E7DQE3_9BACI|nr:DUF3048 domain-containing protein [Domibacillus iocasae]OES45307.1 lipoprotein YerB [Domibacillus iocasae]